MNKHPRRRRLAIEPMENRLLLSGTQQIDMDVYNQTPVDTSPYAVISAYTGQTASDTNVSDPHLITDFGALHVFSGTPNTTTADTLAYYYQPLPTNDTNFVVMKDGIGQLDSIGLLPNGDISINVAWVPPQIRSILPADSAARTSLRVSLGLGDNLSYSPRIDYSTIDVGTDGGSIPINVDGKASDFGNNAVSTHEPQVTFSDSTLPGPGPVTNHPTTPPLSNEGGMIAVNDVLASLQRESSAAGNDESRLALRHRGAGYVSELSASATASENRLSGELARAVSFEIIDGRATDVADHAPTDDGLSAGERLPVEVAGANLALASEGGSIHPAAANAAAADVATNGSQDRIVTTHSGSLPIHLASFVTSGDTSASVNNANGVSGDAAHALVEAAAMPVNDLQSDARGEAFARWSRGDSLHTRRDDDRHGLPWDMAPVLIVLGLERYIAAKRHHEEDENASRQSTRRGNLSTR